MDPLLTRRQVQFLNYIRQFVQREGVNPSLRQIGEAFGLTSPATVHEHLEPLFKRGVLKRDHASKLFQVVDLEIGALPETLGVQIVGFITLGQPLIPNPKEEIVAVPATDLPAGKNIYCLRVRGQGFQPEGLLDRDYLLIEQVSDVSDGSVAVALLNNGTAVIKKVYQEETRIRLMPLLDDDTPLFVKKTKIQGKVLMIIRKLQ